MHFQAGQLHAMHGLRPCRLHSEPLCRQSTSMTAPALHQWAAPWPSQHCSSSCPKHSSCRGSLFCTAAGSDTQSKTGNTDWSQGLLSLTKKKRKKSSGGGNPDALEVAFRNDEDEFSASTSGKQAGGMMLDDDDDVSWDGSRMVIEKKKLPAIVRCFDTARIYVKSGDGGSGCVSFRREPYVEKGGPNGGNGGRGGHVWAVADAALNSLLSFRNQAHFRASNGLSGGHPLACRMTCSLGSLS